MPSKHILPPIKHLNLPLLHIRQAVTFSMLLCQRIRFCNAFKDASFLLLLNRVISVAQNKINFFFKLWTQNNRCFNVFF
jgi:hypothetical protein